MRNSADLTFQISCAAISVINAIREIYVNNDTFIAVCVCVRIYVLFVKGKDKNNNLG